MHEAGKKKNRFKKNSIGFGLVVGLSIGVIVLYAAISRINSVPSLALNKSFGVTLGAQSYNPNWPKVGQASIGALGYGILDEHGSQTPLPTASTIKIMTALAVLKQFPLNLGEHGPSIIINQQDVDSFKKFQAINGSVVAVTVGEQITEYQALQALLLPSANNMADTLASWAFGSTAKYVEFANNFAKTLGLNSTHIEDASGYSPKTLSTAHDLLLLSENALDNPVIAEIINQTDATLPVAGVVKNYNHFIGRDNIIGIKTGNTEQAGGCFMLAGTYQVAKDYSLKIIVTVMGSNNLDEAMNSALSLLTSSYNGFKLSKIVSAGQKLGEYKVPWQSNPIAVVSKNDIQGVYWATKPPTPNIVLASIISTKSQTEKPGSVSVDFGRSQLTSDAVFNEQPSNPSLGWKLAHN